jgi:hypothetical protein
MNYLEPGDVVDAVVKLLNENRLNIKYKLEHINTIKEIAEMPDTNESGMAPPWLGVFYNLEDGGEVLEDGSVAYLPTTIAVLCSSTPGHDSETASLREAMSYARQLVKYIKGDYTINVGTVDEPDERIVTLRAKQQPFDIMQATADLSLVVVKFQYIDFIS